MHLRNTENMFSQENMFAAKKVQRKTELSDSIHARFFTEYSAPSTIIDTLNTLILSDSLWNFTIHLNGKGSNCTVQKNYNFPKETYSLWHQSAFKESA